MLRFTSIALGLFLFLPSGGDSASCGAGAGEDTGASDEKDRPSSGKGKLRGTGMLILDPRDSSEEAKEMLRKLLEEIHTIIPARLHQEANRRQMEALLAADWADPDSLPELSFIFHEEMTAELLHRFIIDTPTGRASEEFCKIACALDEVLDREGVHIHLTRPSGGTGGTVLALEFYESEGPGGISSETLEAEVLEFRDALRENWEEFGYDREPIGRIFGVRVVVGDPRVGEGWMPPE